MKRLPVTFMLLQPQSWSPEVWTDITRMLTLNGAQSAKGKIMHLCLEKSSLVLTREHGYIPLCTVKPGNEVLTHNGRWRKVIVSRSTGKMKGITLMAQGVPCLTLTHDHKIWVRNAGNYKRQRQYADAAEPLWLESSACSNAYVNSKLPEIEIPHVTDYLIWWIVGRWIADGHWSSRDTAVISCGFHEVERLRKKLGKYGENKWSNTGTAAQIQLHDPKRIIRGILDRCGEGASGKKLPPESFTLPVGLSKSLIDGYLSGDGHFIYGRDTYQTSSVSRVLLMGVSMLAQRAYGAIASISKGRPERSSIIQGRVVNCKQEWNLSFDITKARRKSIFLKDDGAWKKVRSIEDAGEIDTWNLHVEEDESYTAEGCIVKNCPMQFDLADRAIEQWSMPGETVLDPFSGLGTVPYRAILQGRYGVGIELSSPYFLDSVSYCAAAEEKIATPDLFGSFDEGAEEVPVPELEHVKV